MAIRPKKLLLNIFPGAYLHRTVDPHLQCASLYIAIYLPRFISVQATVMHKKHIAQTKHQWLVRNVHFFTPRPELAASITHAVDSYSLGTLF